MQSARSLQLSLTITKANCGIPLYQAEGGLTYPIGPEGMADYVELALRSGARIVGACCGSTPDHTAAIREAVDGSVDAAPDLRRDQGPAGCLRGEEHGRDQAGRPSPLVAQVEMAHLVRGQVDIERAQRAIEVLDL